MKSVSQILAEDTIKILESIQPKGGSMNEQEKQRVLQLVRDHAMQESERRMREDYEKTVPKYLQKTWVQRFDDNPRLFIIASTPVMFILFGLITDLLN